MINVPALVEIRKLSEGMCQRIFSSIFISLLCILVALPPVVDAKPGLLSRIKKRKDISRESAVKPKAKAARVSGAKRILYLGDSMSMGAFGRTFDNRLREAGFSVYTYGRRGDSLLLVESLCSNTIEHRVLAQEP